MSRHFPTIELKDADPVDAVTAALDELTKSVDDRLKAIETKSAGADDLASLRTALDELKAAQAKTDAKLARPGIITDRRADPGEIERKAFAKYLRYGEKHLSAEETKALSVTDPESGGHLVPPEMSSEILRDLVQYSPIRALADVRTTHKSSVLYPKRTSGTNAAWVDEMEARPESGLTFGQVEIPVHNIGTFVPVSKNLIGDSSGEVEAEVRLALAEDFGKKEATAFLTGTGTKRPSGILTDANLPTLGAGTTNDRIGQITHSMLRELYYALPAPYRLRGVWLMNSSAISQLRAIVGPGESVWQPALADGTPETFFGRRVIEAVDMPGDGAEATVGAIPILFGDFKTAYRIIDHVQNGSAFDILSDPYTGANVNVLKFHANRRVGGKLIKPEALIGLKLGAA